MRVCRRMVLVVMLVVCGLIGGPFSRANAASLTIGWPGSTVNEDGSVLNDLAFYRVYWDTQSRGAVNARAEFTYQFSTDVAANVPRQATIDGLQNGVTVFVAITAVDINGNESTQYNPELAVTMDAGTFDVIAPAAPGQAFVIDGTLDITPAQVTFFSLLQPAPIASQGIGQQVYTDRQDLTFSAVPPTLVGEHVEYVPFASTAKTSASNFFLIFDVDRSSVAWLAFDTFGTVPPWVGTLGFQLAIEEGILTSDGVLYDVWSRVVVPTEGITLPGNAAGVTNQTGEQYLLFVTPQ